MIEPVRLGEDVTLYRGDWADALPILADNSVDLYLVDPPYFKVKGDYWDRQWDNPQAFLAWLDRMLEQMYRTLKPNGSLYLFASPRMAARVEVLIGERFNVIQRITWRKPPFSTKAEMCRKGDLRMFFPASEAIIFAEHYGCEEMAEWQHGTKQIDSDGFLYESLRAYLDGERKRAGISFEQVRQMVGCADGSGLPSHWFTRSQWLLPTAEHYAKMRAGFNHNGNEYLRQEYEELRRDYEELRRPFSVTADVPYTDVWDFATVQAYPDKHPCEKPLPLIEHIITASTKPGATVVDCCMGTGTTGKGCVSTGRRFVGVDIDQGYFDIAVKRIKAEQMQMRMPL